MKQQSKKRLRSHYYLPLLILVTIFVISVIGFIYKKHTQCQHMQRLIATEQQEQPSNSFGSYVWKESPQGRYLARYKHETLSTYSWELVVYDLKGCDWHSAVVVDSGYRQFASWSPNDSYLVYYWTPIGSSGCHGMAVLTGDGREEVFVDSGCRQNLQSAYQPQRWLDDHRLLVELDSFCPNTGCSAIIDVASGAIDANITE